MGERKERGVREEKGSRTLGYFVAGLGERTTSVGHCISRPRGTVEEAETLWRLKIDCNNKDGCRGGECVNHHNDHS
jgi:hypothetical protein